MRPILVTQRLVEAQGYHEVRDALDVRWRPFLAAAGFMAVPIPSGADVEALAGVFPDLAGIVLTGGNDLSVVSDDTLSGRRDGFESQVCDHADRGGLPVLGVCRGLQFLGVRAGMSLKQLPGHVATRHKISVTPDSRWLANSHGREVNSYHDFAPVELPGGGFSAVAHTGDGAVEAIESADGRRLGIMWHPEREAEFASVDIALFENFFEARS